MEPCRKLGDPELRGAYLPAMMLRGSTNLRGFLRDCLVKVRVKMVLYAVSYEKAVFY
jgi:hypothetical protein